MPYIGKKPADIIATAVDTTTGTFSGAVSASSVDADGGVTVDNITIDGTEIDLSSGNLTLDVAGQLIINSDSGQIVLQDDTVNWGNLQNSSGDFIIGSLGTDKDIKIQGLDGSSTIDALTFDMSDGGRAAFAHNADFVDGRGIRLGAGNDFQLYHDGTDSYLLNSTGDLIINSAASDEDIIFKGNDGGSTITALTLDMSDGGAATFAKGITLTNGNVALANGNGIDFSATGGPTSGSGSTELLDDYEEGTFTPILQNTGGVQPSAYDIQVGFYTKVGRLVHANIVISPNGLGSVGTSNVVLIGGLPYDSLSSTNHDTAISISHAVNLNISSGTNLGGFLPANSTNIRLSRYDSSDGTTDFTFGELSSDGQIKVSIQYNTA